MTNFGEILQPEHVLMSLSAEDKAGAIEAVLTKLNGDARVKDFEVLHQAVLERNAPSIEENGCGICIAHGRTEAVSALVLAAGRLSTGLPTPEISSPLRLVFVAGIPGAFTADYLRIVGAIARICRDKHQLERLLAAKTATHFVDLLAAGEVKL